MRGALAASFASGLAACSLLLEDGYSSGPQTIGAPRNDAGGQDEAGRVSEGGAESSETETSEYRAVVLADGPLAYWPLDEASGTVVSDVSGHGNDGVLEAGRWGANGIAGSKGTSLSLDGRGRVTITDKLEFPGPGPFTIEVWIRPAPPANDWLGIIEKLERKMSRPFEGMFFWVKNDEQHPLTFERWVGGNDVQLAAMPTPVSTERFTHVVVVVDGAESFLFVDGVLVDSQTHAGDIPHVPESLVLGPYWVGELDEIAIYDKALDEARIAAHHRAGVGQR